MSRLTRLAFLLALLLLATGCGGGADGLMQDSIDLMNKTADAIEKGDTSAVDRLKKQSESLQKRMEGLNLSQEEKERILKKYKEPLAKAMGRMMSASMGQMGKMMSKQLPTP